MRARRDCKRLNRLVERGMDKNKKCKIIEVDREKWGRLYNKLPWLSKEDVEIANEERNRRYGLLSGKIKYCKKSSCYMLARYCPVVSDALMEGCLDIH